MGRYDFQNDFQNDAARKNYDAAMTGKRRKGLDIFEKPHLWDAERPCDLKETIQEISSRVQAGELPPLLSWNEDDFDKKEMRQKEENVLKLLNITR